MERRDFIILLLGIIVAGFCVFGIVWSGRIPISPPDITIRNINEGEWMNAYSYSVLKVPGGWVYVIGNRADGFTGCCYVPEAPAQAERKE